MTNVFAVVGEHRQEPGRFLLIGDDGRFYAYASTESEPIATKPSDEWELDDQPRMPDAEEHVTWD